MRLKLGIFQILIVAIIFMLLTHPLQSSPQSFSFELFISIDGPNNQRFPLSGYYDVLFELLIDNDGEEDHNQVVFKKSFSTLVTMGNLTVKVDDDDDLNLDQFTTHILKSRITLSDTKNHVTMDSLNTLSSSFSGSDVIEFKFHSSAKVIHSRTSKVTRSLLNKDLFSLHEASLNVSVGTKNSVTRLYVDGEFRAHAFSGDASHLSNMDYIRWVTIYDPERIYYDKGLVGIGTNDPLAQLHVSGDMLVTSDDIDRSGVTDVPLFSVRDTLYANFSGDAPQVSSLNAHHVSHETLPHDQLFGTYKGITGVGDVNAGIWNSTEALIIDDHVSDALTLQGARIINATIEGTLSKTQPVSISSQSNSLPFTISTTDWIFDQYSIVSSLNTSELLFGNGLIELSSTLNFIVNQQPRLKFNTSGALGINDGPFIAKVNLPTGIKIGDTQDQSSGTIRLNQSSGFFESYSGNTGDSWHRLDKSGIFTGFSLFAEDTMQSPIITIDSVGNIGVNHNTPKESFVVSGNVIFFGDPNADDLSSILIAPMDALAWVANRGALRIGERIDNEDMFSNDSIGQWSVAIGQDTLATGEGAMSIGSPSSNASGSYSGLFSTSKSIINGDNTTLFSTKKLSSTSIADSIIFSAEGSTQASTGHHHFVFNGTNLATQYSNTYIGGWILASPLGNDSFLWSYQRVPSVFGTDHHGSFMVSPYVKVGINSTSFSTDQPETMLVGGSILATEFEGAGHQLSGDIQTDFLHVVINGITEKIYSSKYQIPNHIYVSTSSGFMPKHTVSPTSIRNGSMIGPDFEPYSIGSDKIKDGSITSDNFSSNAIQITHLDSDNLNSNLFSNLEGINFEDHAIDEFKLATDSIYTDHFVDEAVTDIHIAENMINSTDMTINNIALHAITADDIKVERLISQYFATGSATGTTIAHEALSTKMSNGAIEFSYFVFESPPGIASPQVQEHHINTDAVRAHHILDDHVRSNHLSDNSIKTDDLIPIDIDATPNNPLIISDARTVSGPVFIGRHFKDEAITQSKLFDDPPENFQLIESQIDDRAINYNDDNGDELANLSIELHHISPNSIVGRHIKSRTISSEKFSNGSVISLNIKENAINSLNIKDNTLVESDFAPKSIHGIHLVPGSITSVELDNDAISSKNIGENIITSRHIIDKSLGNDDFAPGAFTGSKIKAGTVSSDNLSVNAITQSKVASFNLSPEKLQERAVQWEHFSPPEGPFPVEKFGDDTLDFSTKFDASTTIHGDQITEFSITKDQFNIPTFSVDKLVTPLAVSKGGTGISSFIPDALLYAYMSSEETKMGQTNQLMWQRSPKLLTIGSPTRQSFPSNGAGIITTGSVLVNGSLLLKKHSESNYTYVKYSATDDSIQMTFNEPLDYGQSNMPVKTNQLYSKTGLTLGSGQQVNSIDLPEHFRIGETYLRDNAIAPDNGLIIEGSLQIGGSPARIKDSQNALQNKILRANQHQTGTVFGTSDTVAVISDITDTSDFSNPPVTPIKTDQRTIHANDSAIGIQTTAPNPIQVAMSASVAPPIGIHGILEHDSTTFPAQAIHISNGSDLEGVMSTIRKDDSNTKFSAGIFGKKGTHRSTNYSGYFSGQFNALSLTNSNKTPKINLTVDSIYIEGSIRHHYIKELDGNTIDWSEAHFVNLVVNDFDRPINFDKPPQESAKLFIKIVHTGYGKIIWNSENILWFGGEAPKLTRLAGGEDIVSFYYDKSKNKYFGGAAYNFKHPD